MKTIPSQNTFTPYQGREQVTPARGDSNTLTRRPAPLHLGFARKSRAKRLEFRGGVKCNQNTSSISPTPKAGQDLQNTLSPRRHGSSRELESLRIEYQNLFDRSNKLDNKAYITITFCGFMFVFITGLFGSIPLLHMDGAPVHDLMSGLYIAACIAVSVSYVWNLIWFMQLLAPEGIIRLDPDKIAEADLDRCSTHEAERRLISLYRGIINEDLSKLHARCDRFVLGLRYVLLTLILSFVCYGLQILLKIL